MFAVSNVKPTGVNIVGGKVYKGTSTSSSSQLLNVVGEKVYKGTSTMSSSQLANIVGDRLADAEYQRILYLKVQRFNLV